MNRAFLVVASVLVAFAGCIGGPGNIAEEPTVVTPTPTAEGPLLPHEPGALDIHHLDVGQGDATLIITPAGETILIDTGDWRQDGEGVIAYLESEGIDQIDHLVATHAHADHIGGHAAVIEWAETQGNGIGAAYDSGVPHDSATYESYLDAIEEYNVELFTVQEGDELPLEDDNVSAQVLHPPAGDSGDDLNANSVSFVFEYGEFRYLTTGDVEADGEARMLEEWGDELDADVYQAGHHGSSTSSTEPFMDATTPAVVVISSGFDSPYGHPHDEVLGDLADRNIETYWTAVHGHVVVRTDGRESEIETQKEFSTDAADLLAEKPNKNTEDANLAPPRPIQAPAALITA